MAFMGSTANTAASSKGADRGPVNRTDPKLFWILMAVGLFVVIFWIGVGWLAVKAITALR